MIKQVFNYMYSGWISNEFKSCGEKLYVSSPITISGGKNIKLGDHCFWGKSCVLTAHVKYNDITYSPEIHIGNQCCFGEYNHITSINKIKIGNGVLTGRWVTITDNGHGQSTYHDLLILPNARRLFSKGEVIIEDNVWIGDKVTILPGVTIGKGSIIAANTVVTKSVPEYSVVAGSPGKIIKSLSDICCI